MLFLEFTGIATDSLDDIYRSFTHKVDLALRTTLQRYGYGDATIDSIRTAHAPHEKMEAFFQVTSGEKFYLIIDEYDHFANAVLAENQALFQTIVGKGGFVRSFYETIKAATQRGIVERFFITGVTPLMLDSLTSGFNISKNLSFAKEFNSALGFTRSETLALLQPIINECGLDETRLMEDMTRWYNGYCFHPDASESMYNPDMVLYSQSGEWNAVWFIQSERELNRKYPDILLLECSLFVLKVCWLRLLRRRLCNSQYWFSGLNSLLFT